MQTRFFQHSFLGNNHILLYVLTIFFCFVGYGIGQLPISAMMTEAEFAEFVKNPDFAAYGIPSYQGLALLVGMFAIAFLVLAISTKFLHRKRLTDLISPSGSIRWSRVIFGFLFWILLTGISETIHYFLAPETYTFQFDLGRFLPLFLVSLFLLPIQTSFEEVFTRGYLMQGIAILSRNKWIPLLLTAMMFAALHGANPEIAKFGYFTMMSYYVLAGLFLGLLVVLDDGLELALGVHAAINIFGSCIVSYEGGVLQTDSIFVTDIVSPNMMIVTFLFAAIIFLLVAHKKYGWQWSTLLQKVNPNHNVV